MTYFRSFNIILVSRYTIYSLKIFGHFWLAPIPQLILLDQQALTIINWKIFDIFDIEVMQEIHKTSCSMDFIYFLRNIYKIKHLFTSWNHAEKYRPNIFWKRSLDVSIFKTKKYFEWIIINNFIIEFSCPKMWRIMQIISEDVIHLGHQHW